MPPMSHEVHTIGITGATGGIGSEIMKKAPLYPDINFVAFGRDYSKLESLGDVEKRIYNLEDTIETLRPHFSGIDSIIHLAGLTNERNDFDLHDKLNRQATENLATVASEYGLPFIYTGSTAQYTDNPHAFITDRTPAFSNAAYGGSKVDAHRASQRLATKEARERGYKPIQVVPGLTIGPDAEWTHFLAGGGARVRVMEHFMRDTEIGWSNMDDVTDLLIRIAINPYVGDSERYLAVNGMAQTNHLLEFFADLGGRSLPMKLPKSIEPIGRAVLRVMGKNAPISPEALSFGLHGEKRKFMPLAASKDYGWQPKGLTQTLIDIKDGYQQD